MRYFGKDGTQCQLPSLDAPTSVGKCRKLGRAFLFGRVPRHAVLWLGLGMAGMLLGLWLWSLTRVQVDAANPVVRDAASAVSIRR